MNEHTIQHFKRGKGAPVLGLAFDFILPLALSCLSLMKQEAVSVTELSLVLLPGIE